MLRIIPTLLVGLALAVSAATSQAVDLAKSLSGKDKLVELYSGWPQITGEADFTSDLVFYPMQDPETVFAEFKGDVAVIPTGRQYQQTYGGLFHVVDGKIKLFREYYDPAPFKWAFGLDG